MPDRRAGQGSRIVARVATGPPLPVHRRRWRDGAGRLRAIGVVTGLYVVAALVTSLAVLVADPGVRAAAAPPEASLIAEGAPLASVLVHLAALDSHEARVGDYISDTVAGSLIGDAESLIGLLVEAHGLTLHREGRTLWFDRKERTIVDFVALDTPMLVRALETLSAPLAPGGTVQVEASGRGLVLSGTRAYVRTSLARIAFATGVRVEPSRVPDLMALAPMPGLLPIIDLPTGVDLREHIVLISSRPPRFVELDDGNLLAIGSVLADGRRLAAIEREWLEFESGGVRTTLAVP